jgi:amino acid permease
MKLSSLYLVGGIAAAASWSACAASAVWLDLRSGANGGPLLPLPKTTDSPFSSASVLSLSSTTGTSVSTAVALSSLRGGGFGGKVHKGVVSKSNVANKNVVSSSSSSSGGTATIPNEVLNLVKAIVGVGVLSLPAGIAAFGNTPSVLIPALAMIAGIGALSGYGFAIIGKVCSYTGATSYREAWTRSLGASTSWIPAVSTTFKTFFACLAISMVLADTFSGLLQMTDQRTKVLVGLTALFLLPLCWMKNLASLAPFSLAGVLGMAYTAVAMTVRYLDQSYSPSGALRPLVAASLQPSFGTMGWESVWQPNSLILLCMLSTAYMAHFNAPKFYQELQNNTLGRFHTVVASSFGISIVLMGFITAIGFLTFGGAASGLVLNNYAAQDVWMSASRVAVAISLLFSYPLAFQGCRDGLLDLFKVSPELRSKAATLNFTTVVLLATITVLAAVLKDVSFVLAFGGGRWNVGVI